MRNLHQFLGIIALGALIMVFGACNDDSGGGGDDNGGGTTALVGKWYMVTDGTTDSSATLEITADNHLKMGGTSFDAKFEGGKTIIASLSGGYASSKFDYTLKEGSKVTVSNGTGSFVSFNGKDFEIRK